VGPRRPRSGPDGHRVGRVVLQEQRWAEVADSLYGDFGLQPVLVGGRSARELAAERVILDQSRVPVTSALGSGLRNLVGIMDGSALVLSPDTGPLHMSVALDRPVISLIGYTNPNRFGPYRRFHDLMIADQDLGVARTIYAVTRTATTASLSSVLDLLGRPSGS